MDSVDVQSKIIKLVAKLLKMDESKISPEASFMNDLGLDSLFIVELMMALEDEFKFNIPDEDASKIITINDAVKYIENKLNNDKAVATDASA